MYLQQLPLRFRIYFDRLDRFFLVCLSGNCCGTISIGIHGCFHPFSLLLLGGGSAALFFCCVHYGGMYFTPTAAEKLDLFDYLVIANNHWKLYQHSLERTLIHTHTHRHAHLKLYTNSERVFVDKSQFLPFSVLCASSPKFNKSCIINENIIIIYSTNAKFVVSPAFHLFIALLLLLALLFVYCLWNNQLSPIDMFITKSWITSEKPPICTNVKWAYILVVLLDIISIFVLVVLFISLVDIYNNSR